MRIYSESGEIHTRAYVGCFFFIFVLQFFIASFEVLSSDLHIGQVVQEFLNLFMNLKKEFV